MFKIAMLILILLLVSMNVVEEEAHEYLAFFAAAVFVCHAAAQKWWFSAVCPRFGMALRIKSLSVIALMIVFLFTMISGALLSRYALPMLRVKTIQALMIDVHHSLGMVFLLLSFFSLWRTPFDREDQSNRDSKSRFCYLGNACFIHRFALSAGLCIQRLRDEYGRFAPKL